MRMLKFSICALASLARMKTLHIQQVTNFHITYSTQAVCIVLVFPAPVQIKEKSYAWCVLNQSSTQHCETHVIFQKKNISLVWERTVYFLYSKYAELFQWFKEFLGYKDSSPMESVASFKERTSGELHHLEIGKTVLIS